MEVDNAFAKVFQAFMAIPNAKSQLSLDKPIPPGVLLKYPTVAKEIFSNEPGCTVNYRAIVEKIKVLEPHLKVTSCGPALLEYFAELRKKRNKWAVAFANYQSHMIMTFLVEQKLYGCPLNASQRAAFPDGPRAVLSESLTAAWQELSDIKNTREFVQYVRILEECIKQYKIYLQRKAAAQKQRQALARKKQAEARKAKKAALASSAMSQQPNVVQSTFNPDLPDFAQFISSFASPAPPASAASPKKKLQQVSANNVRTTKAATSTNATVGAKSAERNAGNAAAAEAQSYTMAATSTNMTAQAPTNCVAQTNLGIVGPTSATIVDQNFVKRFGPAPAVRIDKPTSNKITKLVREPGTVEEFMMEEPLFPYFVRQYGYPPPNCFVGPLAGSHQGHKVYIEHQPKYSPEEVEKYKQVGTHPPPARYVSLWEKGVTLQTPATWHMHDATNSNGMSEMTDPPACTVTSANHDVSHKEIESLGLGHPSPPSDSTSTPKDATQPPSAEKANRAEGGTENADSAALTNKLPSTAADTIKQAQKKVEQNASTVAEVSQDVPDNEAGASLSACQPASNSTTLPSNDCSEQTLAEAAPSELMSFEEFTQRFNNGEFQDELPTYDPTLDSTIDPALMPMLDPTLDPALNPTVDSTVAPAFNPTVGPFNQPQDLGMDMGWQGWDGEMALPPLDSTSVLDGYEEGYFFNEQYGRGYCG